MKAAATPTVPGFARTLAEHGLTLARRPLEIVQVNVGKRCNQACHHCHVEAGPKRTEIMSARTAERVLYLLERSPGIHTVDLTGGAPELNPHFRTLVRGARALVPTVIDRCNLTVLFEEGQEHTAEFLAQQGVTVIASLPCYGKDNVERQRGNGVFEKSIAALRRLNALGYGAPGGTLKLHLVYNPVGAFLPPPQVRLEADYRRELAAQYGIVFDHLLTITNMPIKRFLHQLQQEGQLEIYMQRLLQAFNPVAAGSVMCRNLVSVGWDGQLYDCDFNQMLDLPLGEHPRTLWDIDNFAQVAAGPIATGHHCYGCTAGAGSSCGGALA
ncbi:MAG: arsenosugar biosynthesis radical SAM protein ArsS [Sinobacteraceae bacterium]|nr:arsenosugar biosynthesis radical SAM protein ArsS [Nevskiaceae bacterium]